MPIALGGVHVSSAPLIIGLTLVGLGLGLATPGLQTSAVESVHSSQAGSASGLYSTSRYLGSIIGSAIIAGILGANRTNVDAIGIVFLISLGGALIAALSSLGLSHNPAKALD
jgi:DHA2 family methylenomycin A resistance protein-like MFS transporter